MVVWLPLVAVFAASLAFDLASDWYMKRYIALRPGARVTPPWMRRCYRFMAVGVAVHWALALAVGYLVPRFVGDGRASTAGAFIAVQSLIQGEPRFRRMREKIEFMRPAWVRVLGVLLAVVPDVLWARLGASLR